MGVKNIYSREKVAEELKKSNIFLNIGYPEGFPFPPLEAMACGCIVVGYTGGGGNEFMIDGETALLLMTGIRNALFKT